MVKYTLGQNVDLLQSLLEHKKLLLYLWKHKHFETVWYTSSQSQGHIM